MRARDTSPEADAVQQEIYRKMSPERRLRLIIEMSEYVREIAISGEVHRNPGISRDEARLRVIRMIIGDWLFEAAYGNRART